MHERVIWPIRRTDQQHHYMEDDRCIKPSWWDRRNRGKRSKKAGAVLPQDLWVNGISYQQTLKNKYRSCLAFQRLAPTGINRRKDFLIDHSNDQALVSLIHKTRLELSSDRQTWLQRVISKSCHNNTFDVAYQTDGWFYWLWLEHQWLLRGDQPWAWSEAEFDPPAVSFLTSVQ